MAHVVEHVTIELQCMAGQVVGFGRARRVRGQPRHHRVVVQYRAAAVATAALDLAAEPVTSLAAGRPFDLQPALQDLRRRVQAAVLGARARARSSMPPSGAASR